MAFSMDQLRSFGRDLALASHAAATLTASAASGASSREFLDLVKAIGECKSKAEEDRIMAAEIDMLKRAVTQPDVPRRKMKEYIVRLMYVEILGHDASFGYIHAVKMTHDDNLHFKRTGYLACTLFLDDSHEFIILIVNTIQKDLKSDNHLVVCAALGAVCKLINEETIPAVLPQIVELVKHPKELVRKKAVMALHRFHQRSPSSVSHVLSKFKEALCDRDPSVMGASLCALQDLAAADPAAYRNLVPSFVSILKQVVEGRLPTTFNYHKTPAPFIQIKLLKLLAVLGAGDVAASEAMYSVLGDVVRRGDTRSNMGNAILYETICTVAAIHPSNHLLVSCADITSKFLKSDSHNLKYLGVDALARIVKINPDFANEHQMAVIDCLEDPDDTLKRKTLDLLYKMTRPANVEVIVERMLAYLREQARQLHAHHNTRGKAELASRVIDLAERLAPTNQWYIQTMNAVFEVAGDVVQPKVAHDLMRLIAEGSGADDDGDTDADSKLRSSAVAAYVKLVDEPNLPPLLLQVICWVLGEYGTSDGHMTADDVIARLCDVACSHAADDSVRGYVLSATLKVVAFELARRGTMQLSPEAQALCDEMAVSHSTDLQQRAYELRAMLQLPPTTASRVMPEDASCEDIEVDERLSFLDTFVVESINQGAQTYRQPSERGADSAADGLGMGGRDDFGAGGGRHGPGGGDKGLRFEAYEQPKVPAAPVLMASSASSADGVRRPPSLGPSAGAVGAAGGGGGRLDSSEGLYRGEGAGGRDIGGGDARLRLDGVQRKWGRGPPPTALPPAVAASAPGDSQGGASGSGNGEAGKHGNEGSSAQQQAFTVGGSSDGGRYGRGKVEAPAVSEEKQRLAASLFGGGGGAKAGGKNEQSLSPALGTSEGRGEKPRAGGRGSTGGRVWGAPGRSSSAGSTGSSGQAPSKASKSEAQSQPALTAAIAAPLIDLLDLSDGSAAPQTAPGVAAAAPVAAAAAADPFQQLSELTVTPVLVSAGPSLEAAVTGSSLAAGASGGLQGLAAGSSSGGLQGLAAANGSKGTGPASSTVAGIASQQASVAALRDAATRQAGVVSSISAASPELFKDILG